MGEENVREAAWLEDIFPGQAQARIAAKEKGLVVAQKYLVFSGPTADPRARDLLAQWTNAVRRVRVPKNATAQELAAHNALREWVEGIHTQIEFASANAGSMSVDWLNQ